MNHPRSPWARRLGLARLTSGLCGSALAPVLVFAAMTPGAAYAQVTTVQAPHGLTGSAAWREHIRQGVDFQLMAIERVQRAFLVGRCSAWKDKFPRQPSPATVTAANEFLRWMTGEAYTELPQEPHWAGMRAVLPILVRHTFSAQELAAWDAFRESPEGRRAEGIREIILALEKVSGRLADDRSGQYWGWPLARLARFADAHGFGAELDAAFDKAIGLGTAALVRSISLVPAETPADERLLAKVSGSVNPLIETFIAQLAAADLQAYQRLVKFGVLERWSEATTALHQLVADPPSLFKEKAMASAAGNPPTTTQLCRRSARSACQPGGEVAIAVTNYRAALKEAAQNWASSDAAMQIVRGLPSSGCPAPK